VGRGLHAWQGPPDHHPRSPLHGANLAAVGAAEVPGVCPAACEELVPGSAMLARLQGTALAPRPPWLSLWTAARPGSPAPDSARLLARSTSAAVDLPGVTIQHGHAADRPARRRIVLTPCAAPSFRAQAVRLSLAPHLGSSGT